MPKGNVSFSISHNPAKWWYLVTQVLWCKQLPRFVEYRATDKPGIAGSAETTPSKWGCT